jgi:hypothetical protein
VIFSPSLLGTGSLSKSAEGALLGLVVMPPRRRHDGLMVSETPQSDRSAVIRLWGSFVAGLSCGDELRSSGPTPTKPQNVPEVASSSGHVPDPESSYMLGTAGVLFLLLGLLKL